MRASSGAQGVADSRMLVPAQGYSKAVVLSRPLWHPCRSGDFTATEKTWLKACMQEDGDGRPMPELLWALYRPVEMFGV